jgi:5'-methylthioadenosine phosphorylase
MSGLSGAQRVVLDTPFGPPSDALMVGHLGAQKVVFIPRHGVGHRHSPSEIPYLANIWALKKAGVTCVLSISAVGSLRDGIRPGDMVAVDQFIDRTRLRRSTFFGDGVVGHVTFGDPVCGILRETLIRSVRSAGAPKVHAKGTYACMEGPQFSTRAESFLNQRDGADVVGMTNMPEAKLAREAELCYATLALATDYDCWHQTEDEVSVEAILAVLKANVALAQRIVAELAARLPPRGSCGCQAAGRHAIVTHPSAIPVRRREELALFYGKYWGSDLS